MTDRLPFDASAARHATAVAVLAVALLVVAQSTVTAAVTSGAQPMGTVNSLPASPTDDAWADAPSRTVSLSKQQMAIPFGGGSTDRLRVRALTNESHVAFRLTWTDPTNDTNLTAPKRYSDAVAIMLRGGTRPPIMMGAAGTPVNIWYWRASWQFAGDARSEWTGDMYVYPHPANETKPGVNAGNPISTAGTGRFAQNYYARSFGSLSHAPEQNVRARGVRRDGKWSVTFVRERTTDGAYDANFEKSEQMYLAFAVWNGSANEVNGQKSITLQFSTLDTKTGALGAPSGESSAGGAPPPGGSSDGSSGGGALPPLFGHLRTILLVVLVSWTFAYWRATR